MPGTSYETERYRCTRTTSEASNIGQKIQAYKVVLRRVLRYQIWGGVYPSMTKTTKFGTRVCTRSMTKTIKFGTRVPTRVWPKQPRLVPGYLAEYDKTTKFGTRVPTRVWPKQPTLVPGCLPEYDQNKQGWYPGAYPRMTKTTKFGTRVCTRSMTKTTEFGTRVPSRAWPKQPSLDPGYVPDV